MLKFLILSFVLIFSSSAFSANYLVIGDSHSCGAFGSKLANLLTETNNQVTLYCAVSSAPQHWLRGSNPNGQNCKIFSSSKPKFNDCLPNGKIPTLSSLLERHTNANVVVALGTNSLLTNSADATYSQFSSLLTDQNCVWIGPPHLNPAQSKGFPLGRVQTLENNLADFYTSLTTKVGSCRLIDSRPFTNSKTVGYNTLDGVHRTREAGIHWAMQVFSLIRLR
jgi:hypothetical protein